MDKYCAKNDLCELCLSHTLRNSISPQSNLPTTPVLHDERDSVTVDALGAVSSVLGILLFISAGANVLLIVYYLYHKR